MRATARCLTVAIVVSSFLVIPAVPALAQGTIADYQRAMELRDRFDGLAVDIAGTPGWIEETSRFWYRKSVSGGNEFVLVDAATLGKQPAFDHGRLAAALAAALEDDITAITLPFNTIEFVDDETAIEFPVEGTMWSCSLAEYACASTERRARRGGGGFQQDNEPRPSPDGRWEALAACSFIPISTTSRCRR